MSDSDGAAPHDPNRSSAPNSTAAAAKSNRFMWGSVLDDRGDDSKSRRAARDARHRSSIHQKERPLGERCGNVTPFVQALELILILLGRCLSAAGRCAPVGGSASGVAGVGWSSARGDPSAAAHRVELRARVRRLRPPLLYRAATTRSLREFKAQIWPIARLGVILVGVSIATVAVTAHTLTNEFTWAAAFALAAIVSPPDPIAATARRGACRRPAIRRRSKNPAPSVPAPVMSPYAELLHWKDRTAER
ncbi:MAG: hypothetical protein DMF57_05485 [Acidobacteria bacterium]|nr:MAG: hypothetical protein DMF57_05485 [Acidobacteriota bacterium]